LKSGAVIFLPLLINNIPKATGHVKEIPGYIFLKFGGNYILDANPQNGKIGVWEKAESDGQSEVWQSLLSLEGFLC
jgi:hypothetical protein